MFVWTLWIRNPFDMIDLKSEKPFFHTFGWPILWSIESWATVGFIWSLVILKILYFHLFSFHKFWLYLLWNLLSRKLTRKQKPNLPNLKAAIIHNQIYHYVNDWSKVKVHELVRSLLKFTCLNMDFSDHTNQQITDLSLT